MPDSVPDELKFLCWLQDHCGYLVVRPLPGARWAGVRRLMFTHAIVIGALFDTHGVDDQWCYHDEAAAVAALATWDGTGEPAGWHRHPMSGRRLAEDDGQIDGDGAIVARGTVYRRS